MSDFNSALPIRTELSGQVVYEDAIIKLGDATNPTTQQAAVDTFGSQFAVIKDAAGNAIGDQNLSSSWWFQIVSPANGPAAPGTSASFSDLIGGQYNSALPTLTTGQQSAIQVDSHGRLWSNVTNLPSTVDTNYGTVGASTIRTASEVGNATGAADFNYGTVGAQTLRTASQIGNATGAADFNFGASSAQTLRVAALLGNAAGVIDYNFGAASAQTVRTAAEVGNATGAADFNNGATGAQTLRVAANLAVGGANVSGTNPVPVSITSALVGTSVNNYNTVAAVAAGATSNHIYTITATKTFNGKKIWASASGALKIEVRVSPDGSTYSTLWVGFNSTANPNISIDLDQLVFIESGAGSTIEIIRTNEDKKAMDVYSTISGTEV
jgi:hypothetical protein